MRLDKLLSHSGYGTRKEVKKIIRNGYVDINGETIRKSDYQIDPDKDEIMVDGEILNYQEKVYYMLNKPAGYVSATEDLYYPTVIDLIDDYRTNLFPVGRLDIDSEGLLLITNDGKLAHDLTSPRKNCQKVYYCIIEGVLTEEIISLFQEGITIDTGYTCKSALLKILTVTDEKSEAEVTISEGKYHQVKKMFEAVGMKVSYLKRIQIKNLRLDPNLKKGEYKLLNDIELNSLM